MQKFVDSYEEMKLLVQKEGINTSELTIYEFFFHLNKILMPKGAKAYEI
jgi:hypothetical protein